jgi:D-xylose transport system permease protein
MQTFLKKHSTLIALIFIFLILGYFTDGSFLEPRNFTNLTRQISINGLLALGMTLIILTGGIDLSVGSVVALIGVVIGIVHVRMGLSVPVAIIIGLIVGPLCGLINGTLIALFNIPPFIITLGMMVIARGMALIISNSTAISPFDSSFTQIARGFLPPKLTLILALLIFVYVIWQAWKKHTRSSFTLGSFLSNVLLLGPVFAFGLYCFYVDRGLPIPTLAFFMMTITLIHFLQNYPLGRYIFAVGGNDEAAHFAGVQVKKVKIFVYLVMGFMASMSAIILTGRLNSATPTEGNLMELDAIAAVVIGGTSLTGGMGSIQGSMLGAFLIGTINNGMDLMGIDSNYQMVAKGLIIVFAVWMDSRGKK